jgi:hypothetical protein
MLLPILKYNAIDESKTKIKFIDDINVSMHTNLT